MSKENVFKLIAHAGQFVRDNLDAFRRQLMFLFPCFIAVAAVRHIAAFYEMIEVIYITSFVLLYLISCFSLAWHRVSLRGPDQPSFNPFVWQKENTKFHALFMGIVIVVLAFSEMSNRVSLYIEHSTNLPLVVFGGLSSLIVLFSVLYYSVRMMFFLPAQSVGVGLSYEDIKKASKGSMLRFIISMMLTSMVFTLLISIYLLIVTVILQASGAGEEVTSWSSALLACFLSIPIYLGAFFYWAVNVTILSRLYNWGMQNNT